MADKLPVPQTVIEATTAAIAQAMQYVDLVEGFTVDDAESARVAGEQLRAIVAFRKSYNEKRLEHTRPYDALKQDIMAAFNPALEKAGEAEAALRGAITSWSIAEERRVAEERRLENERIAEERRQAEAEAAREAERLETLKTPVAREKAEQRMQDANARAALAEVTAPVVAGPQKIAGVSMRDNWQAAYDENALIKMIAAAAGVPVDKVDRFKTIYLQINTLQVNLTVKAMKLATDIPGVRAVNNKTSAVR